MAKPPATTIHSAPRWLTSPSATVSATCGCWLIPHLGTKSMIQFSYRREPISWCVRWNMRQRPSVMSKIETLTPEQIARFPEFIERWTRIGLCTDPADRSRAEAAIVETYRCAGIAPPKKIVWCGSPLTQGMKRAIILDKKLIASVRASVWDSVRASVWDSVGASVWDSVRASVGASVGDSVRASVWDSVRASVWDSVG